MILSMAYGKNLGSLHHAERIRGDRAPVTADFSDQRTSSPLELGRAHIADAGNRPAHHLADDLDLGTLTYRGSPTRGTAIVYITEKGKWGRVPIPRVTSRIRPYLGNRRVFLLAASFASLLAIATLLLGHHPKVDSTRSISSDLTRMNAVPASTGRAGDSSAQSPGSVDVGPQSSKGAAQSGSQAGRSPVAIVDPNSARSPAEASPAAVALPSFSGPAQLETRESPLGERRKPERRTVANLGPVSGQQAEAQSGPQAAPKAGRPPAGRSPRRAEDTQTVLMATEPKVDPAPPELLVAIPTASTILVPNQAGLPIAVRVGEKLPSGATLVAVDQKGGVARTDRGTLRLE